MTVVHFQRRPQEGQFSLERMFTEVRRELSHTVECRLWVARFYSRGFLKRFYNIFAAFFQQGDINHVTGDVHFLTYLLKHNRTVLTILDCESLDRFVGVKKVIFRLLWYAWPVRCARVVTVISHATKTALLRHVNCQPEKIEVIPCCISRDFQSSPRPFNKRLPRILHIGTADNKNLDRVAEALVGVKCRLHVIGSLTKWQRYVLAQYEIDFTNAEAISGEAVIQAYRDCDILLYVSTYEGFGMPIIEANAVGRPVITSNLSSMPEVANGAARLVNPFDPASIREGIRQVINDCGFREELVEKGYANAQRFSSRVVSAKYLALYRRILEA